MKKTLFALLAAATIAVGSVAAVPQAQARGGAVAAGVLGGLVGGAILGSAIANAPPAYAAPAPVYVEEPPCRLVRERFWDGYGWRFRRVRVCD
ncbi:MAG TPA: hypothetical protein VHC94_18510 [Nitrobacter sp.]|jgi:hypothetical protein|nr:hypothetical protein [Nitrobacter sp.]